MKNIIFILISIITLSSCTTRKACMRKFPPQVTISDSSEIKYIIKDSIIERPAEIIRDTVTITVECPDGGKPIIKQAASVKAKDRSSVTTKIEGNKIITECKCDAEKIKITWLEKQLSSYHKEVIKDPPVIEYMTPWWAYLVMGIMAAIIFYLLFKRLIT
jgi:hypothetical protein